MKRKKNYTRTEEHNAELKWKKKKKKNDSNQNNSFDCEPH